MPLSPAPPEESSSPSASASASSSSSADGEEGPTPAPSQMPCDGPGDAGCSSAPGEKRMRRGGRGDRDGGGGEDGGDSDGERDRPGDGGEEGPAATAASPPPPLPPAMTRRADYYRRLLHSCRRDVRRNLREAKKLVATKLARDLKRARMQATGDDDKGDPRRQQQQPLDQTSTSSAPAREGDGGEEGDGDRPEDVARSRAVLRLESRYAEAKRLDLGPVVELVLRRIGIVQLDPEQPGSARVSASAAAAAPPDAGALTERLLRHKRARDCLEKWSGEVTEYRRWCLRYDERREGGTGGGAKRGPPRSRAGGRRPREFDGGSAKSVAASFQRSVFVKLGGESGGSDSGSDDGAREEDPNGYYGPPGASMAGRKNRPGQRSRRAKADAIRAKEQGAARPRSLNWREPREKKQNADNRSRSDQQSVKRQKTTRESMSTASEAEPRAPQSKSTASGDNSRQDEKAHPSWQAASLKANTGGIVPFQGKKITF